MQDSPGTECLSRGLRSMFLVALPELIYPMCVLGGVQDGYITKFPGRQVLHRGQIINSPPHWYSLCTIGGWIIGKDVPFEQQTSCHTYKLTAQVSNMESQRGQNNPKVHSVAKDIAKVTASEGCTRFSQRGRNTNLTQAFWVGTHCTRSSKQAITSANSPSAEPPLVAGPNRK